MNSTYKTGTETGELNAFLSQKGYLAIPFIQNAVGHLLVDVIINGVKGTFILDTGAGSTVIDTKQASRLNLVLQKESASFEGAGAGGQGLEVIPSEGNKLEIGNYIVHDFLLTVMSLFEHVTEAFVKAGVHEELSGVIGVDVLKPGKAIIDYSGMMLYLLPAAE
jgi:predicted aspartyl protease